MIAKYVDEQFWERFRAGDRLSCARLISLVDNYPDKVPDILDRIFPFLRHTPKIGITGPPGVGKSTITAALARQALEYGRKIAIIAVDPSSPFTGGAFLGDRIRMQDISGNPNVFIRSLASRSGGGLSPSTPYVADVFDAFGVDLILIETVGVGQAELDVLTCSDVIMLVLQPSTGDVIQMLKAGIMETADLFVINKADLPGADQLIESIQFIFHTSSHYSQDNMPPVLQASALKNFGIDQLFFTLQDRIDVMTRSGIISKKRTARMVAAIETSVKNCIWDRYVNKPGIADSIRTMADKLVQSSQSPFPFIRSLCNGITLDVRPDAAKDPAEDPRYHREDGYGG